MTNFLDKYGLWAAPRDAASDAAAAAAAAAAANTPWHQGKVDGETVGFWQNKGVDISDPIVVATKITGMYREAERHLGVPSDQIIRVPKEASDPSWKNVWQRLGAPADPKDYDFSTVKRVDGSVPDEKFVGHMRETAGRLNLPKQTAVDVAASVVKFMDATRAAETAEKTAKLVVENDALNKNWGANKEANMFLAKQGAAKLGFTADLVDQLENVVGKAAILEGLRKVGVLSGEDKFIQGPGGAPGVLTRDQAQAKLTELKKDAGWAKKLMDGDTETRNEFNALSLIIAGEDDTERSRAA